MVWDFSGCDAVPDGDHEDGAAAILVGQDAPDGGGQQHAQEHHRRQRRLLVFWMDGWNRDFELGDCSGDVNSTLCA